SGATLSAFRGASDGGTGLGEGGISILAAIPSANGSFASADGEGTTGLAMGTGFWISTGGPLSFLASASWLEGACFDGVTGGSGGDFSSGNHCSTGVEMAPSSGGLPKV